MILRILPLLIFLLFHQNTLSQDFAAITVTDALKENANAVIRLNQVDVNIPARQLMTVKTTRVVTVLNEKGMGYINAVEHYGASSQIISVEAVVYDALGKEIKKIKKKDFRDESVSQGSILTDDRVVYLHYVPAQYPITIKFTSEVKYSTTAFIPAWYPVEGVFVSVQKSGLSINCNPDLGLRHKEYNFAAFGLQKKQEGNVLNVAIENIPALKPEDHSPGRQKILPHMLFSLTKFNLEGVDGEVGDWPTFGAWMYDNLIVGTDELLPQTVAAIKTKIGTKTDPLEKAKIVYEYVQGKTRYISIQLGIGGWKPMLAKDVDRLGYGDCKALTNYTRALLKAVGVEAYYTVVYGSRAKQSMREDFVSMQGNHVILALPVNNNYVWLECTDQNAPFGFHGNFTDDRLALVIKPGKGELVRTGIYGQSQNTQMLRGNYSISADGLLAGAITIVSQGLSYDNKYLLEKKSSEDLAKHYKEDFSNINNLKLTKTGLKNNKNNIEFTEDLAIEAESYCNKSGNRFIFAVNAFNQSRYIPQRYKSRKNPFCIERGFYDSDEVVINLPAGFTIEAKPDNVKLEDKFGQYTTEYVYEGNTRLVYKRSFKLNSGDYENTDYESYRQFREKIAGYDNAKIVLVKN